MSVVVPNRGDKSLSPPAPDTQQPSASLVVHLHRDAQSCIASFSGWLSDATRVTIDGIADLLSGEESVLLDFSRAEVVDQGGADGLEGLVFTVRAQGARLQMVQPRTRRGRSLSCRRADGRNSAVVHRGGDR